MSELSDRIQGLSAERRLLVEKLLKQQGAASASLPIARVSDARQDLPLSFAQERLWIIHQLDPTSAAYHNCFRMAFDQSPAVEQLIKSLTEVMRRHTVLRTTFTVVDGRPVQRIGEIYDADIEVVDIRERSSTQQERELQRRQETPFDLEEGPVVRASLFRVDDDRHLLLLVIHHIVVDGWSSEILFRELRTLYEAFCAGKPSPLSELPIQYADYACWQRERMDDESLRPHLDYWKQKLTGARSLELPTDRPRPGKRTFRSMRRFCRLDKSLSDAIVQFAKSEGVTLFQAVLAAQMILLQRYSRQDDIVLGTPFANRDRPETEPLIGFFVNMLVMRADLSGDPSYREVVRRLHSTVTEAYAHHEMPFERVVDALALPRNVDRNPLFDTIFAVQDAKAIQELGLQSSGASTSSPFDLETMIWSGPDGLGVLLTYSEELYDGATIERMLTHYERLLIGILQDPDQPASAIPLLPESERRQQLVEWNDTDRHPVGDACVHELIEAQAEQTPDAVAVEFRGRRLTYRQLNEEANKLAHYLRDCGVKTETLVGICIDRSLDTLIGILGILKSGAAYVPLDPDYPQQRLAFMVEDSGAPLIVTQSSLAPLLPTASNQVILLDRDADKIQACRSENPEHTTRAHNLAYVMYTSGSTGKPKGVAVEHRNVVALVRWARDVYANDELAGMLFSTSICFDLSVYEIFVTLSYGGTLIVAENVLELPELPAAEEVTLVNTVPSPLAELLRIADLPSSVRTVNLCGEPLSVRLVNDIYRQPHVERVYDLFGPTEDTVYSTIALRQPEQRATIGKPIADSQVYLLDEHLEPVPIGVAGEIYLGGAGLARGYLDRPELTAERFVENPFSGRADARLYRTGDLAKYLPDGNLVFLGRMDHQVKIRGFRVELGEVEAVLLAQPQVAQAAVLIREDHPGDLRLVAYVVNSDTPPVGDAELVDALKQKLPSYMIPAVFVTLEDLPKTANGKIDRKRLPAPDYQRRMSEELIPPRTDAEQVLADIWCELLNIDEIGVRDSFFELGGHSLMVTQLISRVRTVLDVELPFRTLFEHSTIEELAHIVEELILEEINDHSVAGAQLLPESNHATNEKPQA